MRTVHNHGSHFDWKMGLQVRGLWKSRGVLNNFYVFLDLNFRFFYYILKYKTLTKYRKSGRDALKVEICQSEKSANNICISAGQSKHTVGVHPFFRVNNVNRMHKDQKQHNNSPYCEKCFKAKHSHLKSHFNTTFTILQDPSEWHGRYSSVPDRGASLHSDVTNHNNGALALPVIHTWQTLAFHCLRRGLASTEQVHTMAHGILCTCFYGDSNYNNSNVNKERSKARIAPLWLRPCAGRNISTLFLMFLTQRGLVKVFSPECNIVMRLDHVIAF